MKQPWLLQSRYQALENLIMLKSCVKKSWPLPSVIENMPSEPPTEILAGIVPGHHLLEND